MYELRDDNYIHPDTLAGLNLPNKDCPHLDREYVEWSHVTYKDQDDNFVFTERPYATITIYGSCTEKERNALLNKIRTLLPCNTKKS